MIVNAQQGSNKTDTHPSMYKLVDVSSLSCSIFVLNESVFELVRVLNRCGWKGATFL